MSCWQRTSPFSISMYQQDPFRIRFFLSQADLSKSFIQYLSCSKFLSDLAFIFLLFFCLAQVASINSSILHLCPPSIQTLSDIYYQLKRKFRNLVFSLKSPSYTFCSLIILLLFSSLFCSATLYYSWVSNSTTQSDNLSSSIDWQSFQWHGGSSSLKFSSFLVFALKPRAGNFLNIILSIFSPFLIYFINFMFSSFRQWLSLLRQSITSINFSTVYEHYSQVRDVDSALIVSSAADLHVFILLYPLSFRYSCLSTLRFFPKCRSYIVEFFIFYKNLFQMLMGRSYFMPRPFHQQFPPQHQIEVIKK